MFGKEIGVKVPYHTFKDCDCQKPEGISTEKSVCMRKAPTYVLHRHFSQPSCTGEERVST